MRVPVRNMAGDTVGEIDLSDAVFGIEPHVAVMHQALVRQMANARLGTHATKTRGMVAGGGRKPWRQKGTGRARQGTIRAPQWRGGGTVFGPTLLLPARLDHARDLAIHGQLPETDTAQVKPAHIAARAATSRATVHHTHLKLAARFSHDHRLFGHCVFLPNTLARRSRGVWRNT